jgi:DNA-binding transcriptional ArsR family regulator
MGYIVMTNLSSITDDQAVELAEMFRILGDASRLRIVLACLPHPICVSEIAAQTRLSASLVSHHLRLLRAARILRAERQGKQVFYAAADHHIRCTITDMVAHVAEPAEAQDGPPDRMAMA